MIGKFNTKLTALLLSIVILLSILCGCKPVISLDDIPDYRGAAYVEINGGDPYFTDSEITTQAFERYSELDALGRCGVAFACIGIEIMPTEERDDIASVTPSGWEYNGVSNNNQYDFVENKYVYNRCHLIGFQLAGENDNEKNLITGTRYMNIEGMLPFENMIADYVEDTENHVMYRVTPIYNGFDYVAQGVLMEAWSVEDNGYGICFCIFAYNVQPGVTIDYFTGVNVANGEKLPEIEDDDREQIGNGSGNSSGDSDKENENNTTEPGVKADFVHSVNSKKFHKADANCISRINEENRVYEHCTREEMIENGFEPCKVCNP